MKLAGFDTAAPLIHSKESVLFHKYVLKAPNYIIKILEEGYRPTIIKELELPYMERNNSSALKELSFVRLRFLLLFKYVF